MPAYWLTPISSLSPLTLSSERTTLTLEEGSRLRQLAGELHPRLLPSFKLSLLLGKESGACGAGAGGEDRLHLDRPGDVVLEEIISHCGLAFVDRLPEPEEALSIAAPLPPDSPFREIRDWWGRGYHVMLLKEE